MYPSSSFSNRNKEKDSSEPAKVLPQDTEPLRRDISGGGDHEKPREDRDGGGVGWGGVQRRPTSDIDTTSTNSSRV